MVVADKESSNSSGNGDVLNKDSVMAIGSGGIML